MVSKDKIIIALEDVFPDADITFQDREQQNSSKHTVKECIYVDGQLAGKEISNGEYKLCNKFKALLDTHHKYFA